MEYLINCKIAIDSFGNILLVSSNVDILKGSICFDDKSKSILVYSDKCSIDKSELKMLIASEINLGYIITEENISDLDNLERMDLSEVKEGDSYDLIVDENESPLTHNNLLLLLKDVQI
jgi:hypothetical protein